MSITNGLGHGVATALQFFNGDDLLFPSFQYDPQSNLSSIIGFSLDNNSRVELPRDAEPIKIRFKQVIIFFQFTIDKIFISQPSHLHNVSCGFWNLDDQLWSEEGCRLNVGQSSLEETVCDCLHLTSFNLFMDWTGKCFVLPASPTLDLLTKVLFLVNLPSLKFKDRHLKLVSLRCALPCPFSAYSLLKD